MIAVAILLGVYTASTAVAYAATSGEDDPVSNGLSYTFIVLFAVFLVQAWHSPVPWAAISVAIWLRWEHSRHPAIIGIPPEGNENATSGR